MAMEELLEDGIDLPDHTSLDLASAREATYVFHNEVSYEYPAPIRALRHQFVVLPRHRHGDQRRVTHRIHADVPQRALRAPPLRPLRQPGGRRAGTRGAAPPLVRRPGRAAPQPRPRHPPSVADRPHRADRPDGDRRVPSPPTPGAPRPRPATTPSAPRSRSAKPCGRAMTYEFGVTGVRTTAAEAWALRRGVCQDMAHVMISMCRSRGLAARYVSGHLLGEGASHAWVEVQAAGARSPTTRRTPA